MVQIFADGAPLDLAEELASGSTVMGFTSNPTLARAAGVTNYVEFATEFARIVAPKSCSVEVTTEDPAQIIRQAKVLASLADNVVVKVPVVFSDGKPAFSCLSDLAAEGVKLNVTAVFTQAQFDEAREALKKGPGGIISVFAGRIADTGLDPVPIMSDFAAAIGGQSSIELLWASPREVLNVYQAEEVGCDIITVPVGLLGKLGLKGKKLHEYSVETAKMFIDDAVAANFRF